MSEEHSREELKNVWIVKIDRRLYLESCIQEGTTNYTTPVKGSIVDATIKSRDKEEERQ